MRFVITPAIVIALSQAFCAAHQDAIIEIQKDGRLVGLPKEFTPASIQVEFSKSDLDKPIKGVSITLSGHSIRLPEAILKLLKSRSLDAILASASWYHDDKHLPYYMRIEFFEPGFSKDRPDNPGVVMLLNLRTGKLMQLTRTVITKPGESWEDRSIDLEKLCSPDELKAIYAPLPIYRRGQ